jgi:hypothetical protein
LPRWSALGPHFWYHRRGGTINHTPSRKRDPKNDLGNQRTGAQKIPCAIHSVHAGAFSLPRCQLNGLTPIRFISSLPGFEFLLCFVESFWWRCCAVVALDTGSCLSTSTTWGLRASLCGCARRNSVKAGDPDPAGKVSL